VSLKNIKILASSNKHKIIIFVVLAILILTIITMGILSFLEKNKAKIVETRTFSEIPGFSFEYPVFKGWEVKEIKKISENEYQIYFNGPLGSDSAVVPYINIKKVEGKPMLISQMPLDIQIRDAGLNLIKQNNNGTTFFVFDSSAYSKDYKPKQGEWNYVILPLILGNVRISKFSSEPGFDENIFVDKIIETFSDDPSVYSVSVKAEYGKIVKYALNETIEFPDFSLKYKGTSEIPGPNNAKWSIVKYNFELKSKNETKTISWSSGMGIIGPEKFTVATPPMFNMDVWTFYLELQRSKKYPENLKNNELVVLSSKQFSEINDH